MQQKVLTGFLILVLLFIFPQSNAQTDSTKYVNQESVELRIDTEGNVKVTHEVNNSNEIRQLELVKGTVSNLIIIDETETEKSVEINEQTNSILILPGQGELKVQYDLDDVLEVKNNIWTLNFKYLHTTNFFFPDKLDTLFTNGIPVNLNDKKGLACHGCQIFLEFTVNEPKNIEKIDLGNKEFLVEVITFAELNDFNFNLKNEEINFKVNDSNQFITTIIPLELLSEPFEVKLDDESFSFHKYINNGTHIWLNMRPDNSGEITIKGLTTIDPKTIEPPITEQMTDPQIIIIMASIIGIAGIAAFFLIKKSSRH